MQDSPSVQKRLFSLDVFRGLTMFLLIGEAAGFHSYFGHWAEDSPSLSFFAEQLHHHPWNGLRFWDLIQPFFMFIVGVAMPFSIGKRLQRDGRQAVTRHILTRCLLLFSFGVLLHCVYNHALVWELWNVLVQLSATILIAYAIMTLPHRAQWIISFGLLLLTEVLYRSYNPSDPFNNGSSFGSWFDLLVMGKLSGGGWVAINFLPTAAHTIWGVICGQILLGSRSWQQKMKTLLYSGAILMALGYGLDLLGITPIIKRIATTSFTLASGGWCFITLAFLYFAVDIKGWGNKWLWVFAVVGTNSIFIYLFAETVGAQWVRDFAYTFTGGIMAPLGVGEAVMWMITSLVVWAMFWYLTYFLDRKKVYFKV